MPAVLPLPPQDQASRALEMSAEEKAERDRCRRVRHAATAIEALGHAKIRLFPEYLRVQQEPFEENGESPKPLLWTAALERRAKSSGTSSSRSRGRFPSPFLGDRRFLGLGAMAPVGEGVALQHAQDSAPCGDEDEDKDGDEENEADIFDED